MDMKGDIGLGGELTMRVLSRATGRERIVVKPPIVWRLKNWLRYLLALEFLVPVAVLLGKLVPGVSVLHGKLYLKKLCADGTIIDYGLVGRHLVVTAGKNYLAGCCDNTNEAENLKFHAYGTGSTAAAAGDVALGTEFTTEYVVNSTRPTGSQAKSTNTYTTVGTFSPDSGGTLAVTEWGLFSASSSTTLFDRQVFSAVNLVSSADSLQTTYVLTFS